MKDKNLRLRFIGYLVVAVLVLLFIKVYCQYDYGYAEQMRMFRYSPVYTDEVLGLPGGFFTFLADYLTQFYFLPWGGPLVNIGFFLVIVLLVDVICSNLKLKWLAPLFAVSAGLVVLVKETDVTYQTETTLKLMMALAVVAAVETVCAVFFTKRKNWGLKMSGKLKSGIMLASFVLALVFGFEYFIKNHRPEATRLKVLETMRWHEDWDGILSLPYMQVCPAPLYACYQNLALAHKGRLGELNDWPQMGLDGLIPVNHGLQHELMLLSDVSYAMGNVADAQMFAFNAMISSKRLATPTCMVRLIETNLILGHEKVAEKYIKVLETTKFYAERASSYRKFLGHPELVEEDKDMGPLKRVTDRLEGISGETLASLQHIVEKNPDFQPAKDYLNGYVSLSLN